MIPRLSPRLSLREILSSWLPCSEDEIFLFEKSFSKLMNVKHSIAFPYGRTGLTILLKALGLQGREVICPAYTCVVVPHAIVTSGNEPVFVDSQELDFNMDLSIVEKAINKNTSAIIATSIFGYPVNLDMLKGIQNKYPEIKIIQDCAHSFSAEWNKEPVHIAGDAAIFGLNISKIITSIFGGMVTTNQDELAIKLRSIRDKEIKPADWKKALHRRLYLSAVYPVFNRNIYGLINRIERLGLIDRFVKYYDEGLIDMPKDYLTAITGVEARVGRIQTSKYHEIIEIRRQAAYYYNDSLNDVPGFHLPPLIDGATYSHYVPRTNNRNDLLQYALKHGVQLGQLIEYSIPNLTAYRNRNGSRYPCPNSEKLSETTINLPVWSKSINYLEKVVSVVRSYYKERGTL